MKIGKETVIRRKENFEVIQYSYYFESKEEIRDFQLMKDEQLIECSATQDEFYPYKMVVQTIRSIRAKQIYDMDEYKAFIKNLQRTQYSFGYNNEWYNNWIDYINKIPYNEACALIELLNEFYVAGKENI